MTETAFPSGSPSPSFHQLQASFPEALQFLFQPARYKVAYGGRGGTKSWGFARALLIRGAAQPTRVLCTREIQNSIDDSVLLLLEDQIRALGLQDYYRVLRNEIRGRRNDTMFVFDGLHGKSVESLKSFEGADVCWVEEANSVLKRSWEVLIPTIRKEGSEIWVSFNPELDTDETYKRFVTKRPPGAVVKKLTWRDNPWFPKVLRDEMEHLKETDFDAYLNVWEGECRVALEGAIYAREIRAATSQGRITRVPWEASVPVHIVWDLGHADSTAIWFVQMVGFEYRIIDFYQAHGQKLAHYIKTLKEKPYAFGDCWLPHDATHQLLGAPLTVQQQLREQGFRTRIAPKISVAQGIEAARTIFSKCWFDDEKCSDGLQSLRHYRYDLKADGISLTKEPLHDWSSHAADAFRYLAIAMREDPKRPSQPSAFGDYDPLVGLPSGRGYGRTIEHTDYDPLA